MQTDVIVVGAGPSGLMVAGELAAAGVPVLVLEKRGEPALTRAGVLQPRVLEIFEMRGFADRVLDKAKEINGDRYRTAGGIWAGLPGIDYGLLDTEHGYITVLAQIEVERILAERCTALGTELRRGVEVTGVRQDADGVVVETADGGAFRAAYVVGADGGRSAVRESLGIAWAGHDARNLAINVDATVPYPFEASIHVENNPRGWGLCYPLSETVTRFGVIDRETMLGVGRDTVISREVAFDALRRVFGSDYGTPEAADVRVSQFHDAMFRAERMREGRVLLVGESVRVHYPASGVGMNFALQDAFNLGWKIAAELQGWGAAGLLDTYETERGADVDAHLQMVKTQTGIQFDFSDEALALKDFLMRRLLPLEQVKRTIAEMLSGLATHYGQPGGIVGAPIRNLPVEGGRLFPAIRPDGYLVVHGGDAPPVEPGPRVTVVRGELPPEAGEGVVIRPDGYVAAAGDPASLRAWLEGALPR